ncbi:MAG: RNA methyltransferase, partial [Kiritimatiellae bacterium]|nr:RNA methyltransferase [Kiritimatiellia bacterium]
RFPAPNEDALYKGIQSIDWTPFLTHEQTLSVSSVCNVSKINHSGFAALKTKDAIVDQIRGSGTTRPSVDKNDPDVRIFLYIVNDKATVYLDMSGESLHRRGYRNNTGAAPLRETLAAAMLRISGWDRVSPLIDPMCGSGTIAIEAAMWANNIAPGLSRERFGFERWANFGDDEKEQMRELRGKLRGEITREAPRIIGYDLDSSVLEYAKENAKSAGVRPVFKQQELTQLQGNENRTYIVTNPPYGVRLDKKPDFCQEVAKTFCRLHGWRVALLAGSPEYEKWISRKPRFRVKVPNGDLKCDYLVYDIP